MTFCSGGNRESPWAARVASHLLVVTAIAITLQGTAGLQLNSCERALGMSSMAIRDSQITASSFYDSDAHAHYARANIEVGGRAWCPQQLIKDDESEFLEIDLVSRHVITKVEVQGRYGNGHGREFAEFYKIRYWRPTLKRWVTFTSIFGEQPHEQICTQVLQGNTNTYLVHASELLPPVFASRLRFVPYSSHPRFVCMRVEVYGCNYTDGLLSYSFAADQTQNKRLRDLTYDGIADHGVLSGGLGELSDGVVGITDRRSGEGGLTPHTQEFEWVGWSNESGRAPVAVAFEFDQMRNFSAIHLMCRESRSEHVQVFSSGEVFAADDRDEPFEKVEEFHPQLDWTSENKSVLVSILLRNVSAKFIRLELYFASKWIWISEVTFDSVPCNCSMRVLNESSLLFETVATDHIQPNSDKAPILSAENFFPDPTEGVAVDRDKSNLMMGFIVTLGVLFSTLPVLTLTFYYRNKSMKRAKAQNNKPRNESVSSNTFNNGIIVNEFYHSIMNDSLYQVPYQSGMYNLDQMESLTTSAMGYEEPLLLEDALAYAVPDVALTSTRRGCRHLRREFMSALLDIPPPPIPPPPEEPSHSPPPSDIQGVVGSAFFALPESIIHREDPAIVKLFPQQVSYLQIIGESTFGYAQLCEVEASKCQSVLSLNRNQCKTHVLKKLKKEWLDVSREKLFKEMHILSQLDDDNIACMAGILTEEESPVMVLQFTEYGDLYQFLRKHCNKETISLPNGNNEGKKHLSHEALLYMGTQVASAMKYLESKSVVHRDLAARNCLVGRHLLIKISDIALSRTQYADHYCDLEGRCLLPVRWMAPETIIHSLYTVKSDVWSFGVTFWEIMTMARQKPLENLSDEAVIERICQCGDSSVPLLPQTVERDLYQLMMCCWSPTDTLRPTFWQVHAFLKKTNIGYTLDYED